MSHSPEDTSKHSKAAILRRALLVSVLVFFFGVGLFIALVVMFAKLASKGAGPNGVS